MLNKIYFLVAAAAVNINAHCQPACPTNPMHIVSAAVARAGLDNLRPLFIKDNDPSICEPKVVGFIAFGKPLCLLDGEIPVIAAAYEFISGRDAPIGAMYLVEYSEKRHNQLASVLKKTGEMVDFDKLPEKLRNLPIHEELTATFKNDSVFMTLQKPSDGMPGNWYSLIKYEHQEYIPVTRRDFNTCQ